MTTDQTKRGSSSRLSPLARPFTINRSNSNLSHRPQQHSSATVLPRSFSDFTLEGDSIITTPYAPLDASPTFQYGNHSSVIGPNSYFSQCPSRDFQLPVDSKSDFDVTPIDGTIPPGYIVHKSVAAGNQKRVDHLGIPRWKDNNAVFPISCDISSKQGNTHAEGLKPCGETSDSLCGKWIGMSGKDNEIISKDAMCVSFPTSMISYPQTKLKTYCSSESHSSAVEVAGPSGTATGYLPLDLILLHNLDSIGHDSFIYYNPFGYNPIRVKDLYTPLVTKDKEVSHKILRDESKDRKNGKPVVDEVMDSLVIPVSNKQITNAGVPHNLILKLPDAGEGEPFEDSSKMSAENDSDLDSPCWKGTLDAYQNTFADSGPMNSQLKTGVCWKETLAANPNTFADSGPLNSQLKTGQESLCGLNGMASHLFPFNVKQSYNYYENEHGGGDSSFSLETASSAVNLLSKEQGSVNSVPAGSSSSDLRNMIGTRCSDYIHIPDKEDALKNSSSSSLLSFSSVLQPSHVENHCKSMVQLMAGPVAVSVRGTKDDKHNSSTSIFSASKNFCSSSSFRVGIPSDFIEKHGGATRSFSRPPRLDIQKTVITLNKLSELIVQNCSNDLDSFNEHERDIVKHIINNLNMCIENRIGEPETADLPKCSIVDLQATRAKSKEVSHNLHYKKEHEKQISNSSSFSGRLLDSFWTSKDDGTKRG